MEPAMCGGQVGAEAQLEALSELLFSRWTWDLSQPALCMGAAILAGQREVLG